MGARRGWRVAAVVAALVACSPPPPVVVVTTEPLTVEQQAVAAARGELAAPLVEVARLVTAATRDYDVLRHELPRGEPMAAALTVLEEELGEVAAAAEALAAAAEPLHAGGGPEPVVEAAGASAGLAGEVRAAVAATRHELALLHTFAAYDADLAAIPRAWEARGSQSERRDALARLLAHAQRLAGRVPSLPDTPAGCNGLAENRGRWADLLVRRTAELAALAQGSTGAEYDALRARFRRAPFGEDRAVADAALRPCWERLAALPPVVGLAEATVPRVEDLLQA